MYVKAQYSSIFAEKELSKMGNGERIPVEKNTLNNRVNVHAVSMHHQFIQLTCASETMMGGFETDTCRTDLKRRLLDLHNNLKIYFFRRMKSNACFQLSIVGIFDSFLALPFPLLPLYFLSVFYCSIGILLMNQIKYQCGFSIQI